MPGLLGFVWIVKHRDKHLDERKDNRLDDVWYKPQEFIQVKPVVIVCGEDAVRSPSVI